MSETAKINIALPILWGPEWKLLSEAEKAIALRAYDIGVAKRLSSSVTEHTKQVVDAVFETIEETTSFTRADIVSNVRLHALVEVRFAAIATIRELTSLHYATIARLLGQIPTSTNVRYALEKDSDWRKYDPHYRKFRAEFTADVKERLRKSLSV